MGISADFAEYNLGTLRDSAGERFSASMNKMRNSLKKAGDEFAPIIDGISNFISRIAAWLPENMRLVTGIGKVALVLGGIACMVRLIPVNDALMIF